jgi:adenosine deaminase
MTVLLTPSDFETLTYTYLSKAHAQNVRHVEISFDPQAHTERGIPLESVITGLGRARSRAESEFGMSVLFIACFVRHLPVSSSTTMFETLSNAGLFSDGTLAGIGLDSTEKGYPPGKWRELYRAAGELGVRRTAHAGEEGPVSYVTQALDELSVTRVDHGVRAVEDEAVLARLAREGVMLTVCPISNVRLKCVGGFADVPVRKMLDAGVRFSLNSDDPAYFGGYIQEVWCKVQETFGLCVEEWEYIVKTGIEGSWCDEGRKGNLMGELREALDAWTAGPSRCS